MNATSFPAGEMDTMGQVKPANCCAGDTSMFRRITGFRALGQKYQADVPTPAATAAPTKPPIAARRVTLTRSSGGTCCCVVLDTADEDDAATAGAEPEVGVGAATAEDTTSCATGTVPELAGPPCRDSVSRFSRFRSARISEAC